MKRRTLSFAAVTTALGLALACSEAGDTIDLPSEVQANTGGADDPAGDDTLPDATATDATDPTVSYGFDLDNKTDLTVWRPSTGAWWITRSTGGTSGSPFGSNGDVPVSGDYDGDGLLDSAVFRPSDGNWYIRQSSNAAVLTLRTNQAYGNGIPVSGDFDGDTIADIALYNPNVFCRQCTLHGGYSVTLSSTGEEVNFESTLFPFSTNSQDSSIPVVGDFNGDAKTDMAVFVPRTRTWAIRDITGVVTQQVFGSTTNDVPVSGDFDGDGKSDLAVWSNGSFVVKRSSTGATVTTAWGMAGDKIVPGDFDGDRKTDYATWRRSNGTWYIKHSSGIANRAHPWGTSGDIPVGEPFVGRPQARVKPEVRVIKKAARDQMRSFDQADKKISFSSGATNFAVGNILVSQPSSVAPYGVPPSKVVSKSEASGVTTYTFQESSLDEALIEADLNANTHFSADQLAALNPALYGGIQCQSGPGLAFNCTFTEDFGTNQQVQFTANFGLGLTFQTKLKITLQNGLESFLAAVQLDEFTSLALKAQIAQSFQRTGIEVKRLNLGTWVVWLGPIPVVMNAFLHFTADANGQLVASVEYAVEHKYMGRVGVKYEKFNGGWGLIRESTTTHQFSTITPPTADGSAKLVLKAAPGVGLWAIAQVDAEIGKAKVSAECQFSTAPSTWIKGQLEVCAGIRARVGINLRFIKKFWVIESPESCTTLWAKEWCSGSTVVTWPASASATSQYDVATSPSRLVDGSFGAGSGDGYASQLFTLPSGQGTCTVNQSLTLDLGSTQPVKELRLVGAYQAPSWQLPGGASWMDTSMPREYTVSYSTGGAFTTAVNVTSGSGLLDTIQLGNVQARYVRVTFNKAPRVGGNSCAILVNEMQVRGPKTCP